MQADRVLQKISLRFSLGLGIAVPAWVDSEAGEQGKPMHNLGQVVGLYILVEIAPDVVLNLVVALLGILHSCVLVLAQPLLHNSLKQIFP